MKLKTLLLSSAAAFAFVGAAQAADLSVAEPVESVRVCDAFGAGFWYIPGGDTCLKISGYARFDVNFHSTKSVYASDSHAASWDFTTKGYVDVTAESMTEYGPLVGYVALQASSDNADATNQVYKNINTPFATLDVAWIQLGMLQVGRFESTYHYFGSYMYGNGDYDAGDNVVDQVALTWAMSGFGLQLAIEDPRDRWGSSLSSTYSMPDVVGNITWSAGNWDAKLSGGFGETTAGSGFGAQLGMTFKLDSIAAGDALALQAAWAQSEVATFGAGKSTVAAGGSVWSALVGFKHYWAPTLVTNLDFEYFNESGATPTTANGSAWEAGANLVWSPVTNFSAGVEGTYKKVGSASGVWGARIRLQRNW